jgi:chromosome segregation ATPase
LTEERTSPFLDQIMTIQRAHRAQRDEDTTLIESLENKCQTWRTENNQLVANLAKSVAETGLLAETEKDQMKMILENNTKISFLAESLKLLEEHTTMKNQDIAELNRMVGCLSTAFDQAKQSLEVKGVEAEQLALKLEILENEEKNLQGEICVRESTIRELNDQLYTANTELNEFRCEYNMHADLLASCEHREIALQENEQVLQSKINQLEDEVRYMTNKVEMRDEDILNLLTKVNTAHKDVCRLDNKAGQLIVEKQLFEMAIEKKEEEISALTKEVKSLGNLMKGSENVLDAQMNLLYESEEKLKTTIESLLHSEIAKVEKQEDDLKQNESYKTLLENTKIEAEQLNGEIKSLSRDLQKKEEKINELEMIRQTDQDELMSMRAKRVKYEEKIDSLIELASMMEDSNNTCNGNEETFLNLKNEKVKCETQIVTLNDQIETLSAALKTAENKTENLSSEVLTLNDKIGNLSTLLDLKENEIGLLSQRLDQSVEKGQVLKTSLLESEQRVVCLTTGASDAKTRLDVLKNELALSVGMDLYGDMDAKKYLHLSFLSFSLFVFRACASQCSLLILTPISYLSFSSVLILLSVNLSLPASLILKHSVPHPFSLLPSLHHPSVSLPPDRIESLSQALLSSEGSVDSLTVAMQERDLQIISLNNSLEESVVLCAELTETEMRLQKELNAQIAASTEEIEALSCTHNEAIKVLEESVQRLTLHTDELQRKIFFERQRWTLEGVYDCETYDYSTESKTSDDEEVKEVVVVVEGEVNLEGDDESVEELAGEAFLDCVAGNGAEKSNEACDFNFGDIAGTETSQYGLNSGLNDFESSNEMFKTEKPEIRKESKDMRNGKCRLSDSYGSVAERFFEFGNPLLSQKMGNKKRDGLPKLVDRSPAVKNTNIADTVPAPSPAPTSKLQMNWRLAKQLKRSQASLDETETETAYTLATMVSEINCFYFHCFIDIHFFLFVNEVFCKISI